MQSNRFVAEELCVVFSMDKVHVEILPILAETLGIEITSEEVIPAQENCCDRSVRGLFHRLGAKYQRFGQLVFDIDAQKLTGIVAIFCNGRDLELLNGLDTKLMDGDTLTFVPRIEGG
ncbi:MoaD/ThiS family protein [Chloroflexota bacterium]